MPLQVAKHYTSPQGMPLRWSGPLLSVDVWPAVSKADEVLTAARQQAAAITHSAETQAAEMLSSAQAQAQLEATQANMAAQREVWQGVLQAWLGFVGRVQSQRPEALEFALLAVKVVVGRLKLDASAEQQMLSSVSLLLEHSVYDATGELRVHVEDAQAVLSVLNRLGRTDVVVTADADKSRGFCELRCGELSFETQFDNNVQVILGALEQMACSVNER